MWGYIVIIFMAAISFLFLPLPQDFKHAPQDMSIITDNFNHYQGAVIAFYNDNPGTTGVIPDGSLNLISGYSAIGPWQNQVAGGILYIYTPNGQRMVHDVVRQMKNSRRVGLNRSGRIISPLYGDLDLTLPAFIPEGSLVTVFQ